MKDRIPIIFSIPSYAYLAKEVAELTGYEEGEVEVKYFPDGERYQRVVTAMDDREVILVGGTWNDQATLELFDLACSLVKHGALGLTICIPYFAYSTMERGILPGEVVTAKSRARLLSSIPTAARGNSVCFLDLHSEGLPYYMEGGIVPRHLYAKSVIIKACRELGKEDFVLACTDAGRAKWVESLANDMGVPAAFVFKKRMDGRNTRVTAMSAMVEDAHVIIYDDMIRTGGSLINAARAYLDAGANRISAITTHGVLPEGAMEKLAESGLFQIVVSTNSHPRTQELKHPLLKVESVAGIFARYLVQRFGNAGFQT